MTGLQAVRGAKISPVHGAAVNHGDRERLRLLLPESSLYLSPIAPVTRLTTLHAFIGTVLFLRLAICCVEPCLCRAMGCFRRQVERWASATLGTRKI